MALVRVFSPLIQPEMAVVTSLLEAHEIPVFVHTRYLGSLYPGVQIDGFNTQSIMVPEECVPEALELLAELRPQLETSRKEPLPLRDRLRILLEGFLGGWFVPVRTRARDQSSEYLHGD